MKSSVTLLTLIVYTIFCSCITDGPDEQGDWSLPLGSDMPRFEVNLPDGTLVNSEELEGQVAVIILFNTSCPDCRAELPVVDRVSRQPEVADVRFLCIARDENLESISRFWQSNSLTLPFSPQEGRQVYSLFAESVIPRIMIFDADSRLTASFVDSPLPSEQSLLAAIRNAMSDSRQ